MRSVADDLRRETIARVLALPPDERIHLALALGDDDLALFVQASGLDPDQARRRLRNARSHGRVSSVANDPR